MKFIDHNSPEKAVINNTFKSLSYMDMWISNIVEGYIYEKVYKPRIKGREEYMLRYGEKSECKVWRDEGHVFIQTYFKKGILEGEYNQWHSNGQISIQCYYKEGRLEGECKWWYRNGKLLFQSYHKEGKREGEYKKWDEEGNLTENKIYENGEIIQDLLTVE